MTAEIDEFASSLLEESKRFLEKAREEQDGAAVKSYLHAGLMLAFSALEAHTNAIANDFEARGDLSPNDRGVLLEKEVRLEDGEFRMGGLRMYRLEDRILFLYRRFSGHPLDRTVTWWSELAVATGIRNKITHPRIIPDVSYDDVSRAIQAVISCIDALYQANYKRSFPAAGRGLQSRLTF